MSIFLNNNHGKDSNKTIKYVAAGVGILLAVIAIAGIFHYCYSAYCNQYNEFDMNSTVAPPEKDIKRQYIKKDGFFEEAVEWRKSAPERYVSYDLPPLEPLSSEEKADIARKLLANDDWFSDHHPQKYRNASKIVLDNTQRRSLALAVPGKKEKLLPPTLSNKNLLTGSTLNGGANQARYFW